jgi:hypothetical protein
MAHVDESAIVEEDTLAASDAQVRPLEQLPCVSRCGIVGKRRVAGAS